MPGPEGRDSAVVRRCKGGKSCRSAENSAVWCRSAPVLLQKIEASVCALGVGLTDRYTSARSLPGMGRAPFVPVAARGGGRKDNQDLMRMMVSLPPDYRPTEDEDFMNPLQVE